MLSDYKELDSGFGLVCKQVWHIKSESRLWNREWDPCNGEDPIGAVS